MDLKKPYFGELPPHWNFGNPMENKDIAQVMDLLYRSICCAASIVYRSDDLLCQMFSYSGHTFANFAILHKTSLLLCLSKLVTMEPTNWYLQLKK